VSEAPEFRPDVVLGDSGREDAVDAAPAEIADSRIKTKCGAVSLDQSPTGAPTEEGSDAADLPAPAALAEMLSANASAMESGLQQLSDRIGEFNTRSAEYEANARLLHARIESLQQDQVRALLKPAFERLATLHAQAVDASSDAVSERAARDDFDFFATSIEELLGLYDLDSVDAAVGSGFDPRHHHAARTVRTTRSELDGTIQRVIRQGFAFAGNERVLLPARVGVYRFAPEPLEEGADAEAPTSAATQDARSGPSAETPHSS
jgi:molecular chaperone GrpE (heat shock protein)